MPRYLPPADEIARLKAEPHDKLQQYSLRLPTGIALLMAQYAAAHDVAIARALVNALSDFLECDREGLVCKFDPATRRQLDLAATFLSLDREALVKLIVGENLSRYLSRAVAVRGEREENERVLRELDTASPPPPAKPRRGSKPD